MLEPKHNNPGLTAQQKNEIERANIYAATGLSGNAGAVAFSQVINACFKEAPFYDASTIATTSQEELIAMNPRDAYEGMLCGRLFVLHNQYMVYMARAAQLDQPSKVVDLNINRATKLMRVYNETLEALNRYRRKGEQKVTVQHQHINVGNGGQAAVGNFQSKGGGDTKK